MTDSLVVLNLLFQIMACYELALNPPFEVSS